MLSYERVPGSEQRSVSAKETKVMNKKLEFFLSWLVALAYVKSFFAQRR